VAARLLQLQACLARLLLLLLLLHLGLGQRHQPRLLHRPAHHRLLLAGAG
jgi:hypothetical protein